jgi:perosamine synthetase
MYSAPPENIHTHLTLRPAVLEDAEMIFTWRNLPEIVAAGEFRKTVTWEEHQTWFEQTIKNPDHLLLIIKLDEKPIGQVRFDLIEGHSSKVSIYLLPEYTGHGLGVVALKHSCWKAFSWKPIKEITARVRKDNHRSLSAFKKAGFTLINESVLQTPSGYFFLQMERPADVPHNRITYGVPEEDALLRTVKSGQWAQGSQVIELETALAHAAGVKQAVCVASGLSALRLVLIGLGVKPGDKILIPAYACVALANAVLACGALPIPVDVTPHDWNLSISEGARLKRETHPQAVIAVNTFGLPAPVEQMLEWGIPIIEDCAHAFGQEVNGKLLGGRTHAAILSFYATKLLGAGEGGAVLTDSSELARFVKSWRDYNDQMPDGRRLNDKMTDLEASLALCQLNRLPEMLTARRNLARRYHALLEPVANQTGAFQLPDISRTRVWYRYPVEMTRLLASEVIERFRVYGIQAAQPVNDWRQRGASTCPVADRAYRSVVSLPLYPTLTEEEQERVVYAVSEICREDEDI